MPKKVSLLLLVLLMSFNFRAYGQPDLKPFVSGSYQQILSNNAKKPFMLVVWSIDCSSCIKDMTLLNEIHQENPGLKIIMLAADEPSVGEQVKQLLSKYKMDAVENWLFADENAEKLRFEIDPKWYGELPRTYFFNAAHQRIGISGVLSKKDILAKIAK
jgi:thiol-disulfide isomerase/thioredoxin